MVLLKILQAIINSNEKALSVDLMKISYQSEGQGLAKKYFTTSVLTGREIENLFAFYIFMTCDQISIAIEP